jgi:hypothetical protein
VGAAWGIGCYRNELRATMPDLSGHSRSRRRNAVAWSRFTRDQPGVESGNTCGEPIGDYMLAERLKLVEGVAKNDN